MTTKTQLAAAFTTMGAACGLEVGDKVKVLRSYTTNELGCDLNSSDYEDEMQASVGKVMTITDEYDPGEFELDHDLGWPFFVLEKVGGSNIFKLNDDYRAEISEDGTEIEVGCQTITAERVLQLADRIREVQTKHAAKPKPATRGRKR